jgi:FMN phosphatase YigB (HAD superfamily)
MITTILSDFSNVILTFSKPSFLGSLNGFYRELLNSGKPFNFFDYYSFNQPLLDYYKKLGEQYSMNIFTTSQIQNDPNSKEVIKEIFNQIFSAEDLGVNKTESGAYRLIAEKLGKEPEEIVFIDDQLKNVEAAQKTGMVAIQYKNVQDLKEKLEKILHG